NHHALVRAPQVFRWSYVDSGPYTKTDHKVMDCVLEPRAPMDVSPTQEARRFNLKYLVHARVCTDLCNSFNVCAETFAEYSRETLQLVEALSKQRKLDVLSLDDRQRLVDDLDESLVSAIHTAAEEVCGSYVPSVMRATADRLWDTIPDAPSLADAIRTFKRATRAKTVTLTSRDPLISPAEDAVRHFESVFKQTQPEFLPPAVSPYRGRSFESESSCIESFNATAISKFWEKYPAHVSGGDDGVHIRLLRALTGSSLPFRVADLFRICCYLGVTPSTWNCSVIFPIPKGKETTINKFRPISLTLMLRRTFEKLLLWLYNDTPVFRLHSTQAGFRRGFSTLTHALTAHESAIFGHRYR
ncbi:hypothetical protein BGW38_009254, partial [Lunasporangiospora selenospora]